MFADIPPKTLVQLINTDEVLRLLDQALSGFPPKVATKIAVHHIRGLHHGSHLVGLSQKIGDTIRERIPGSPTCPVLSLWCKSQRDSQGLYLRNQDCPDYRSTAYPRSQTYTAVEDLLSHFALNKGLPVLSEPGYESVDTAAYLIQHLGLKQRPGGLIFSASGRLWSQLVGTGLQTGIQVSLDERRTPQVLNRAIAYGWLQTQLSKASKQKKAVFSGMPDYQSFNQVEHLSRWWAMKALGWRKFKRRHDAPQQTLGWANVFHNQEQPESVCNALKSHELIPAQDFDLEAVRASIVASGVARIFPPVRVPVSVCLG